MAGLLFKGVRVVFNGGSVKMNKEEFLRQLERLLSGISEEERSDAIAFYRSYFEDAGEQNEAAIIAELESPQKTAEGILKNLGIEGNGGYYNSFANRDAEYYKNINETVSHLNGQPKQDGTTNAVLIVVAVLTSPIWLTLLLVLASVMLVVVATLFGLSIAVVAVMASLVFVGFVLFGCGIATAVGGTPAVGIGLMGGGLIVLAIGLLLVLLVIWLFGVFLPWALKGIWSLCKKPFDKRKERASI